jgi:hypothetical protein
MAKEPFKDPFAGLPRRRMFADAEQAPAAPKEERLKAAHKAARAAEEKARKPRAKKSAKKLPAKKGKRPCKSK